MLRNQIPESTDILYLLTEMIGEKKIYALSCSSPSILIVVPVMTRQGYLMTNKFIFLAGRYFPPAYRQPPCTAHSPE